MAGPAGSDPGLGLFNTHPVIVGVACSRAVPRTNGKQAKFRADPASRASFEGLPERRKMFAVDAQTKARHGTFSHGHAEVEVAAADTLFCDTRPVIALVGVLADCLSRVDAVV